MRPWARIGVPVLLALLAVLGIWLVVAGGSGDDTDGDDRTPSADEDQRARLDLTETDMDSIAELVGLELPASTAGFTTARLDDDTQLDVTFTIDPDDEQGFLEASGFPAPVADQRVTTHASPLWQMNPDATIRGVADTTGEVDRALELVEDADSLRVRLVVTPAG
ncbi:MAG: hypothetical protein M9942_07360 [Microthrixaceae bacterium]|nr:hypothetical protein [Microthrixaceae bacterium]MCO5318242.1 hypothetical protein [Microthrixaceae bacterium]